MLDRDSLIMRLPFTLRVVVATIAFLLVVATNANLAYMMTQSAPSPVATVVEQRTSSEAVSDSDDQVAVFCSMTDVVCENESDILTIAPRPMDFVLTIEAESGFNPKARNVNRNGTIDSGLSQINHYWHPKIVKDPRFKDWKFQLEKGWELYKGGTVFYGSNVRHKVKNRFVMK